MIELDKAAWMIIGPPLQTEPLCRLCREARSRSIVHGHRLASLHRASNRPPNPFIVLEIHKILRLMQALALEYLWNNEAGAIA